MGGRTAQHLYLVGQQATTSAPLFLVKARLLALNNPWSWIGTLAIPFIALDLQYVARKKSFFLLSETCLAILIVFLLVASAWLQQVFWRRSSCERRRGRLRKAQVSFVVVIDAKKIIVQKMNCVSACPSFPAPCLNTQHNRTEAHRLW